VSSSPWHERHPEEYERVRKSIEEEFPYLQFSSRDEWTVLAGTLPVVEGGRVIADYEIEICIPADGPRSAIPVVRETSTRIPREVDRHNAYGVACLVVTDEFWYRHPTGMDLIEFLRGPVTSFFVSQMYFDLHGHWPYGQRSHYGKGVREFYAEILGTADPEIIGRFLGMIAAPEIRRNWWCPCGSKRRMRDCHHQLIRSLRERIPRTIAAETRRMYFPKVKNER
jgi:hypothetical protein